MSLMVNYLSDSVEIVHVKQLKDGEYNGDNHFSNLYATPIITLLIRVISVINGQLLMGFS